MTVKAVPSSTAANTPWACYHPQPRANLSDSKYEAPTSTQSHECSRSSSPGAWTPPTPPTSSSPLRQSALASNAHVNSTENESVGLFRYSSLSGNHSTRRVPKAMPLRSSPNERRPRQVQESSSPAGRESSTTFLTSGNDWHSRFKQQCAQRARLQRQHGVNTQRNGLLNEIVRPGEETREELVTWKKMALKERQAIEIQAKSVLEDNYIHYLEDTERMEETLADDSPADLNDVLDPDSYAEQEYEAYLASLNLPEVYQSEDASMEGT